MTEPFLTTFRVGFDRGPTEPPSDIMERIGSALTHPFHYTYGNVYCINRDGYYESKPTDRLTSIALSIASIATLPITLLGVLFLHFSSSYQQALARLLLNSTKLRVYSETEAHHMRNVRNIQAIINHAFTWLTPQEIAHHIPRFPHRPVLIAFVSALQSHRPLLRDTLKALPDNFLSLLGPYCGNPAFLLEVAQAIEEQPRHLSHLIGGLLAVVGDARNPPPYEAFLRESIRQLAQHFGEGVIAREIHHLGNAQLRALQTFEDLPGIQYQALHSLRPLARLA